jgi:hypothetical protein
MGDNLVHVWGDYYVKINDMQYTLIYKRLGKNKEGKDEVYEDTLGHWTTLVGVFNRIMRNEQANAALKNIIDLYRLNQKLIEEFQMELRKVTNLGGK